MFQCLHDIIFKWLENDVMETLQYCDLMLLLIFILKSTSLLLFLTTEVTASKPYLDYVSTVKGTEYSAVWGPMLQHTLTTRKVESQIHVEDNA